MTVLNENFITSPVTLTTTAETAAITVTSPPAGATAQAGFSPTKVMLQGYVNVTAGTGTTSVQIRVKTGSGTGGAQLHAATPDTHTLAAGASASIPFFEVDESFFAGANGMTYTVTVQQVGASGNGTVNAGTIEIVPCIAGA